MISTAAGEEEISSTRRWFDMILQSFRAADRIVRESKTNRQGERPNFVPERLLSGGVRLISIKGYRDFLSRPIWVRSERRRPAKHRRLAIYAAQVVPIRVDNQSLMMGSLFNIRFLFLMVKNIYIEIIKKVIQKKYIRTLSCLLKPSKIRDLR